MQTVFITSGGGNLGRRIVPLLLSTQQFKLVLPTSNAARLTATLPKSDLVTVVEGSIKDPQWVESQLKAHNVTAAFVCLTGTDELFTTLNMFSAFQRTPGFKHIVYLSACGDLIGRQGHMGAWKLSAHCAVKTTIEFALRDFSDETGITSTVLGATLFYSNDLRQREGILKGTYVEPLGKLGASRVCEEDIAEAVKIAFLDGGEKWGGEKINLGSRKRYMVSNT
jgi:nucleoside-diphosphate-sugar epimerase